MVLIHIDHFIEINKDLFTLNKLSTILGKISGYNKNTIKNKLIKSKKDSNFLPLKNQLEKSQKEEINLILKHLESNFIETFKLLPELYELAKIEENIIKNEPIENYDVLKKFLKNDEIEDITNKKFTKSKIITLKASYFNLITWSKNLFPGIKENTKNFFTYYKIEKEKNLLKAFFNSKIFNMTPHEKRNIRNIIKNNQLIKFKTFEKYISFEYKKQSIYLYFFYLYLRYLTLLKKELNIEEKEWEKFINFIIIF
ncbi:hypothetical protein [Caminibacter pacificus]|uniref:Uncharacterized protein n=1 Tax=Caminibacter pacificus TaxID=1424653 RepID=A0AAJ4RDR1_9BACT|nr:hypothetical protein [Caminibacter pacificus]ROR40645.1 hypothetical protein EDC58_0124 [Caminibacter pacificus]